MDQVEEQPYYHDIVAEQLQQPYYILEEIPADLQNHEYNGDGYNNDAEARNDDFAVQLEEIPIEEFPELQADQEYYIGNDIFNLFWVACF